MSVLEQISNEFVQTYIGLHRLLSVFLFASKIFITGTFFIAELSSNMPYSCTSEIKFALIEVICNLPSLRSFFLSHPHSLKFSPRFLHFNILPHPYSHLYLIEKRITVEPVLSIHQRGMTAWQLHTGWPLCRFHRIRVLWITIKRMSFYATIGHFMYRNYLTNTIESIWAVPL